MDCENLIQQLSNQQSAQTPLVGVVSRFLSVQEAAQIIRQFQSENWIPNGQVLWSGILREKAQEWADRHQLQTLTTAMGPLMDENHPECLKSKKNLRQWSRYVHGASAIFAWRIAQGEKVTLLSPPPPERFHPSGLSYFQLIEEPIIRGLINQNAVQKILITHPIVAGNEGEEFYYELWPNDRREKWVEQFGSRPYKMKWRRVGHSDDIAELRNLMASSEGHINFQKVGFIKPAYGISLLLVSLFIRNKVSIFILFGLLCSLFGKMREENNARMEKKRILKPAEPSSTVISAENTNTEQATTPPRQESTGKMANTKKQARVKAGPITAEKPRDDKEAKGEALKKTQQEVMKKPKDDEKPKRKFPSKANEETIKKLKNEVKAETKALDKEYQKAIKRLKNESKAKRKVLEEERKEAAEKLRDEVGAKRKALDKAHQTSLRKLKDKMNVHIAASTLVF